MYFEVHLLYKLKWTLTEGKYERLVSQQEVLWIDHMECYAMTTSPKNIFTEAKTKLVWVDTMFFCCVQIDILSG